MVTYLACPRCTGVFAVEVPDPAPARTFTYATRDGAPLAGGDTLACGDCGAPFPTLQLFAFSAQLRVATDALPPKGG